MSAAHLLIGLGTRHRGPLAFTYVLTAVENAAELLYPFLIGRAIDGLLAGRQRELGLLGVVMIGHLAVGIGRHLYDTRVFTAVYGELAGDLVLRQRAAGEGLAPVAARVGLAREIIDFFQVEVPAIATAAVRFVGTVVLLLALDWRVGLLAIATLAPIGLANAWFARRSARLHAALNDAVEREVEVVARASPRGVARYFRTVRFWRVRVSDAEAGVWGVVETAMIAFLMLALLIVASDVGATVGSTFAVLGYVLAFGEVVDDVPYIVQNLARVNDIAGRVAPPATMSPRDEAA